MQCKHPKIKVSPPTVELLFTNVFSNSCASKRFSYYKTVLIWLFYSKNGNLNDITIMSSLGSNAGINVDKVCIETVITHNKYRLIHTIYTAH